MANTEKISVNISGDDKQEIQKIAAEHTLKGKETNRSDVVRKFIKAGIKVEQDKK